MPDDDYDIAGFSVGVVDRPKIINSHARDWVESFVQWCNYEYKHSGIGYVTPYEKLTGMDKEIFKKKMKPLSEQRKRIQNAGLEE